ncbi:4-hydroxythreonine-4-phosphate dehydrogenase PdxA [Chloroflexota bacterium]
MQNLDKKEVILGQVCKACGKATMEYIAEAARLALRGKVKAVVTAPINKEAIISKASSHEIRCHLPSPLSSPARFMGYLIRSG